MKKISALSLLVLLFAGGKISAQTQTLKISNLNKKEGKLYIAWYDKADDFRKSTKAFFSKIVPVNAKESLEIGFDNIPAGTFAVAIFFDRNNNGKLDTNVFGIPTEKYGFSNNVFPMMRAASFEEAAFKVTGESATISIRLK